jgi:photosystem II stability/assembly factor-like uncharacterized protein
MSQKTVRYLNIFVILTLFFPVLGTSPKTSDPIYNTDLQTSVSPPYRDFPDGLIKQSGIPNILNQPFFNSPNQLSAQKTVATENSGWQCWDPSQLENPCHLSMRSVSMLSSTDGWAVGDGGAIIHWNGSDWSNVSSSITTDLYSIQMLSSTDGWAVGKVAAILHWDGSVWNPVNSPSYGSLYSISMLTSTDGWAVGDEGAIIHWNGSVWSNVASSITNPLHAIQMLSSTDGWAMGSNILRWNGSTWNQVENPSYLSFSSISMLSSTDGWAVGSGGAIIHWNGSVWSTVASPTTLPLWSIQMLSSNDGWIVGLNDILRWNGSVWSSVESPTNDEIYSISMLSSTDGWAVGDGGDILHWDGNVWSGLRNPTKNIFSSVQMISMTDGWAIGAGGIIMHWNGTTWGISLSPTAKNLSSISMVSPTDGWAVGWNGVILHWNGSSWSQVVSPTNAFLHSISMISSADGWAVGYGVILHWDGNVWGQGDDPQVYDLFSISMLSSTDGWAVGGGGVILHWNGSVWNQEASPTNITLHSISMTSATDGWAVGWNILHWNGSVWSEVTNPASGWWLYSVHMLSSTDGWAVGYVGVILHWDGFVWSQVTRPQVVNDLFSISMVSPTEGWAVGSGGVILHFSDLLAGRKPWLLMYYLAGDNDRDVAINNMLRGLKQYENRPAFNIAIMYDAKSPNDSMYYYIGDHTNFVKKQELDSGDPLTLIDFVQWAKSILPSDHTALILYDHGSLTHAMQDINDNPDPNTNKYSIMKVNELGNALNTLVNQGGKFDVLFMETCLMGSIEDAYQFRAISDYYVASENELWMGPITDYLDKIKSTTNPEELSVLMALYYADFSRKYSLPFTISVARMSNLSALIDNIRLLAEKINSKMTKDLASALQTKVLTQVQRFDSDDNNSNEGRNCEIDAKDEAFDLYDFSSLVKQNINDIEIQNAAQDVMNSIQNSADPSKSYILLNDKLSWSIPIGICMTHHWDLDNSHGVYVFFNRSDSKRSFYNGGNLDFALGTNWALNYQGNGSSKIALEEASIGWGNMLVAYTNTLYPNAPDDPTPPPLIAPLINSVSIYLPIIKN